MSTEDEIYRRLKVVVSEIVLRHGRRNSSELRAAVLDGIQDVLADYPDAAPASDWFPRLVFVPDESDPEDGV